MKLSQQRKDAIYRAVSDRLIELRIEVSGFMFRQGVSVNDKVGVQLDTMIAKAQGEAASAAIKAAEKPR